MSYGLWEPIYSRDHFLVTAHQMRRLRIKLCYMHASKNVMIYPNASVKAPPSEIVHHVTWGTGSVWHYIIPFSIPCSGNLSRVKIFANFAALEQYESVTIIKWACYYSRQRRQRKEHGCRPVRSSQTGGVLLPSKWNSSCAYLFNNSY